MGYQTLDQFLAELPSLAEAARDALRDTDGLFRLDTEKRTIWVRLQDGQLTMPADCSEEPDCTVSAQEQQLLDLLAGRLNPAAALLFGKVRVKGNKAKLMKLVRLAG